MSEVRPFARGDREQLTQLANAHIAAAMPGWSVPSSLLLAQLERQPGEYVVDPWVTDRATVVSVERDRIVAASHLRRYAGGTRVSESYRDAGEIAWLICWPTHLEAGRAVVRAAVQQLQSWQASAWLADGSLPTTATYGISDAWPHVAQLLEEAGFSAEGGQAEVQLVGDLASVPLPGAPPSGVTLRRVVGPLATSFDALLDGEVVGSFEVDDDLSRGGSNQRLAGWADECNHWVRQDLRGRGIGTWLVCSAAAALRLGNLRRLLVYLVENDRLADGLRYYARYGLGPVNRTRLGWKRPAGSGHGSSA